MASQVVMAWLCVTSYGSTFFGQDMQYKCQVLWKVLLGLKGMLSKTHVPGAVSTGPKMQLLPLYGEGKLQGIGTEAIPGSERPAALDGESCAPKILNFDMLLTPVVNRLP